MKKFKFNPTTAVLVAGLAASAYATCYVNVPTQAICFRSGTTVDIISWGVGAQAKSVIATADWTQGYQNNAKGNLQAYLTASLGSSTYNSYGVSYCYGPAQFMDNAGNTDTVSYWENGVANNGSPVVPPNPANNNLALWGAAAGTTCP